MSVFQWLSLGWYLSPYENKGGKVTLQGPTLVAGLHLVQGHDDPKVR